MITIKVLSEDGWQNGELRYEQGKVLALDCDAEAIQPWVDCGDIEIVKAKDAVPEISPEEKIGEVVKDVITTANDKFLNILRALPQTASVKVRERVEDDPKGGFKGLWDFGKCVYEGGKPDRPDAEAAKRLRAYNAKAAGHMAENEPSEGGYLVPVEFRTNLMQTMLEKTIVRPRATFVPMRTNSVQMPALSDYDHRESGNGLCGAIRVYRPAEAGAKTASKPEFDRITLSLHKKIALTYVSEELLEDSPISIEPLLNRLFTEAIAWHDDNDFINGTGANMPLGVLNAPCLISVTRSTCGDAWLNYTDIVNMWSRLHPASMGNSVWFINNALLPYLYQLCYSCEDCTGSVITGTAAFMPGNGASDTPYNTLLGRPVIVTEHCPALGHVGDIILGDWSQYLIGGKTGGAPRLDSSIHLKFDYDETAFRAVLRDDGQPWWKSAMVPKHTTSNLATNNTLSPFITLTENATISA